MLYKWFPSGVKESEVNDYLLKEYKSYGFVHLSDRSTILETLNRKNAEDNDLVRVYLASEESEGIKFVKREDGLSYPHVMDLAVLDGMYMDTKVKELKMQFMSETINNVSAPVIEWFTDEEAINKLRSSVAIRRCGGNPDYEINPLILQYGFVPSLFVVLDEFCREFAIFDAVDFCKDTNTLLVRFSDKSSTSLESTFRTINLSDLKGSKFEDLFEKQDVLRVKHYIEFEEAVRNALDVPIENRFYIIKDKIYFNIPIVKHLGNNKLLDEGWYSCLEATSILGVYRFYFTPADVREIKRLDESYIVLTRSQVQDLINDQHRIDYPFDRDVIDDYYDSIEFDS